MYDFVVYGATGFTGKRIARRLPELLSDKYTYAIAGRNQKKLEKLKEDIADDNLGIIIANSKDLDSIFEMCKNAKVLLNCVGPYRFTGEDVVKNCIKAGTHYLDITGEPEFMERMQAKYFDEAKENGCFVVSSCGFDSIPADLGTIFMQKLFQDPSICTYIETHLYLTGKSRGNFATYESFVNGVGDAKALREFRKQNKTEKAKIPGKKPSPPSRRYSKEAKGWLVPFPGADASVVKRTQNFLNCQLNLPATHFHAYVKVQSNKNYYKLLVVGGLVFMLTRTSIGRGLLLRYPGFFTRGLITKDEPNEEDFPSVTFYMDFLAKGYSDRAKAETEKPDLVYKGRVTGGEPGYVVTSMILVQAARCLLEELEQIKDFVKADGGVYTPGITFYSTSLIERLDNAGVKFQNLTDQ